MVIDPLTLGLLNYSEEAHDEEELHDSIQELRDNAKYSADHAGVEILAKDALAAMKGERAIQEPKKSKSFCAQTLEIINKLKSGAIDRSDARMAFKDVRQQYLGH